MGKPTGRIVIIGAGIAGASTAYFLARQGVRNVVLLDRESVPGLHSTGRNAAILRTAIPDAALHSLARESMDFFQSPPDDFCEHELIEGHGLYLAANAEHASKLDWAEDDAHVLGADFVEPSELYARVPDLAQNVARVLSLPDEGAFDVQAILDGFLRGARQGGVDVRLGVDAQKLVVRDGAVAGVETNDGILEAEQVMLATGGWGGELSAAAGYPLELTPVRRHLLVTSADTSIDAKMPTVWFAGSEFYFRPESGGLMLSSCDESVVSPNEGEVTVPEVLEDIAVKTGHWLPKMENLDAAHFWAGMRTFSKDHTFVIGPDSRLSGLHWAAGLGGHGITTGPAVGRLAAEWLMTGASRHKFASAFTPERLLEAAAV